jgi:hypothetical protein
MGAVKRLRDLSGKASPVKVRADRGHSMCPKYVCMGVRKQAHTKSMHTGVCRQQRAAQACMRAYVLERMRRQHSYVVQLRSFTAALQPRRQCWRAGLGSTGAGLYHEGYVLTTV